MSSSDGSRVIFSGAPADVRPGVVRRFASRIERDLTKRRTFNCLITGDAQLRRFNREFRGQDHTTDVLSFPSTSPGFLGDVAISSQRARMQARRFGHSTEDEMRILMLHGVLHLLGYDHETDAGRMARAEKRWRARLGLPVGLIERVGA